MPWREVFIGALVTLVVTVGGGLAVFYFTRQPAPEEYLVYQVDDPYTFETEATAITFLNIRAGNLGEKPAHDVYITVLFPTHIPIQDRRIQLSSGPFSDLNVSPLSANPFEVRLPYLRPSEVITMSFMLSDILLAPLAVSFRSDSSIGSRGQLIKDTRGQNIMWPATGIGVIAFAYCLLAFLGFRYVRSRYNTLEVNPTLNNTAFLLLHTGDIEHAEALLKKEINIRGLTSYEALNFALVLGLKGDADGAEKYFRIGRFIAKRKHTRALYEFNKAVLAIHYGDVDVACEHLRSAFQLSPKTVSEYCKISTHIQKGREENREFSKFVEERCIIKK